MFSTEYFNDLGSTGLPGLIGIVVTKVAPTELQAELPIRDFHMAGNGLLHAGTVVTLADTCAGYGCVSNLPLKAVGFTTVELKSNHLRSARDGTIVCLAKAVHLGKTTQVWDAAVTHLETNKTIALFRCTQMILYSK